MSKRETFYDKLFTKCSDIVAVNLPSDGLSLDAIIEDTKKIISEGSISDDIEGIKVYANKTIDWANERNLIEGGSPKDQFLKVVEEAGEIYMSFSTEEFMDGVGDTLVTLVILAKQLGYTVDELFNVDDFTTSLSKISIVRSVSPDALEHSILAMLAELSSDICRGRNDEITFKTIQNIIVEMIDTFDVNFVDCFSMAYNEIKDRKGRMIDGIFVKESDLPENQ